MLQNGLQCYFALINDISVVVFFNKFGTLDHLFIAEALLQLQENFNSVEHIVLVNLRISHIENFETCVSTHVDHVGIVFWVSKMEVWNFVTLTL